MKQVILGNIQNQNQNWPYSQAEMRKDYHVHRPLSIVQEPCHEFFFDSQLASGGIDELS